MSSAAATAQNLGPPAEHELSHQLQWAGAWREGDKRRDVGKEQEI